MKLRNPTLIPPRAPCRGSVLIIVLWVAFGLVAITLYFAHSMRLHLQATDNQIAGMEASQAIDGVVRNLTNVFGIYATNGTPPDATLYREEAVRLGESRVWLIGRDTNAWQRSLTEPHFGIVDESSKLNLNTATVEMLELLPLMTPQLAASIVDWRDADSDPSESGAEDEYYNRLNPSYRCKNAPFETIEELRLVAGADLGILFGEDTNLNGILDPNEDDGDASYPADNQNGRLDSGILEFVTVATREPNTNAGGTNRVDISNPAAPAVATILRDRFGPQRANQLINQLGNPGPLRSVLEFGLRAGMTADELAQIESDLSVTNATTLPGRVNINTAGVTVLTCIPGIGADNAATVVGARTSARNTATSLYWLVDTIGRTNAIAAAPYLTTRGFQYTIDAAAVGHHQRGYQRVRYLIDTADGFPRIAARRDLTHLGWALGRDVRRDLAQLADQRP